MTGTRNAPTADPTLDVIGRKFDEAMGRWLAQPRQVGSGKVSLRSLMRSRAEGIGQMLAQGGTYQDVVTLMAEAGIENPSRAAVAKYAAELGIGRRSISRKGRSAGLPKVKPVAPKAVPASPAGVAETAAQPVVKPASNPTPVHGAVIPPAPGAEADLTPAPASPPSDTGSPQASGALQKAAGTSPVRPSDLVKKEQPKPASPPRMVDVNEGF